MILNISEIIKKSIEQKDFNIVFNESVLTRDDFKIEFVSPIKLSGTVFYNGKTFNLKGVLETSIKLQCARCLNFLITICPLILMKIFQRKILMIFILYMMIILI